MLFNSTTNPTLTTYALIVLLSFAVLPSYGQAVNENFNGFNGSYNSGIHTYNDFEIIGGIRQSLIGNCVGLVSSPLPSPFYETPSSLEYVGGDGSGKDGGIGVVSFQYNTPQYDSPQVFFPPSFPFGVFFYNGENYVVEYSTDGGVIYNTIGNFSNYTEHSVDTFTAVVNKPGDDIKVRVRKVGVGISFNIDNFSITNFFLTATWTDTNSDGDGDFWDWNDDSLDGTAPTLVQKAEVFIAGNYDTSVGGPQEQQSFGGANLTVNSGSELTIADGTFVEIDKNLTVNGSVVVQSKGAFVQVDDSGIVDGDVLSLSNRNKITVLKNTAPLAILNEYTYWSSPVAGERIEHGLNEANPNRIYYFEAQNYRDSNRLINNTPAGSGQDDVDDDYNDWQSASGATIMAPGVGYAALNQTGMTGPNGVQYVFEGPFNNGVIEVPIYRNDAELADNNWNLIGNPYPSAIDVNAFLDANSSITDVAGSTTGAIFLWSQATDVDMTGQTNGNDTYNYLASEYAIMNRSGGAAGGDGQDPNPFIPSGQGFFIAMDNAASSTTVSGSIETTDVVFNNSMRVTGNNNQFFRSSINDQPNKLWIDLTSDNGVFNQILVAYVDGATDGDDGMSFDADKNLSSGTYASLYSTIATAGDKKFAIQGKDPSSLGLEEVISVGFKTSIPVPTLYTLSIRKTEGAFMTDNAIYLKDNLLNIIHELSSSDYTFTSEAGEFNERFEIVFTTDALSIDENVLDANALTITELTDTDVAFNVSKGFTISNVKIFDLLGRQIYDLEGSSSREVYNLAKLTKAAYIAKVTLDNGQVISKKAIKQK